MQKPTEQSAKSAQSAANVLFKSRPQIAQISQIPADR
jgi:hypothetical protein